MHSFTWANILGRGVASPVGLVGTVVLVLGYAWAWRAAHRAGEAPPVWRAAVYVCFGVVPFAVATCSGLAALRDVTLQAAAWQAGLLVAVVPAGLALGEPVSALRRGLSPAAAGRLEALLGSRLARALAYPAVTTTLAVVLLLVYLLTPWFQLTLASPVLREATYVVLVGAGCLLSLPLLGELDDALPPWCTPGVRVLLAFADGLADAIPGIVVMTATVLLWHPTTMGTGEAMADEHLAGGVLLGLSELIGIPVLIGSFIAWMRADAAEARATDRLLDELEDHANGTMTPWWVTEPARTASGEQRGEHSGSRGASHEPEEEGRPASGASA